MAPARFWLRLPAAVAQLQDKTLGLYFWSTGLFPKFIRAADDIHQGGFCHLRNLKSCDSILVLNIFSDGSFPVRELPPPDQEPQDHPKGSSWKGMPERISIVPARMSVPAFLRRIGTAAAGEFGHAPLKRIRRQSSN
jgi:hypothetical protein